MCDEVVESPLHALRDCTVAVEAINCAFSPMLLTTASQPGIHQWFLHQVRALSKTDFAKLLMLIWSIWGIEMLRFGKMLLNLCSILLQQPWDSGRITRRSILGR